MYDLISDTDKKERLIDLLEGFLGEPRNHYGRRSQITFDCPRCSADKGLAQDGKGNLEVNYKKGIFKCWSCANENGMHGTLFRLICDFGGDAYVVPYKELKLTFTYLDEDGAERGFKENIELLKLPDEFVPLSQAPNFGSFRPFFDYLTERRVLGDTIHKHNIGCALTGPFKDRIILPSYDEEGVLNYFTSRSIKSWVKKFKYKNCSVNKLSIIFNENLIDWTKTIFIVEGPFDHIVIPNSIPLLGKDLSETLLNMLYFRAETNIVLVLDPDAWERTVQIYNKLDGGRLSGRIYVVKMPQDEAGKDLDPSKFNERHGQQALFNYLRNNTLRIID